jgi:N-acetylneuraminic acid mutarotase/PKD repeat protein
MKKLNPILLALMLLISSYVASAQNYTWSRKASSPQGLYTPASFTLGDSIYVVSGVSDREAYNPKTLTHDVWMYNSNTNTWTPKASLPGVAIYAAVGFTIGNKGYVTTGFDSSGSGTGPRTTYMYDPSANTWTQKASFPGNARYTSAVFVLNGKAYVSCGFSPALRDMYCYDPIADTWTQKTSLPGIARQGPASFVLNGEGYVGLGSTGDNMGGFFVNNDVYKYNDATDTWTQVASFPGNAVAVSYNFTLNNEAYLVNGLYQSNISYTNVATKQVWKYSPVANSWTLWGLFPDTATFGGIAGTTASGAYMGYGAKNYTTYPLTNLFYRFGPGTAPYSCNLTINKLPVNNAQYNFQANGNFSPTAVISWSFGDGGTGTGTSVLHSYATAGGYAITATVTDTATGCSNVAHDSVYVSNISNCSTTINSINYGPNFTLTAPVVNGVGPYTYLWTSTTDSNFVSTAPNPLVNVPYNTQGTYCVSVTDTTGCIATDCKTLVDSQMVYPPCSIFIVVYPDSNLSGWYYATIYVSGANHLSYLWDFGDGSTSNQLFPSHTYATPGYYTICLTVSDTAAHCSFTFCDSSFYAYKNGGGPMKHFQVNNQVALGIKDVSSSHTVGIYPNPANAEITIQADGQKVDHASIYNIAGQKVIDTDNPIQNKVSVSQLPDGIYVIDIKVKDEMSRIKFTKMNK